jgi:hypothetical protein
VFDFTITGADRIVQRIESMQQKIEALGNKGVPDEFVLWQRQDMKRRFPKIEPEGAMAYFTMVYPRSRRPKTQRKKTTTLIRSSTPRRQPRRVRSSSNRPILRPELLDRLRERMRLLLHRVTWRV